MPSPTAHHVIIIPGIGDNVRILQFLTRDWSRYQLAPHIYPTHWQVWQDFSSELIQSCRYVDSLKNSTSQVSLVGTSAGSSFAINIFAAIPDKIHKVINVGGRLRQGNESGFRSFDKCTNQSPAFRQSILLCEENLGILKRDQIAKIMTIHPRFGDELVPANTAIVSGADNRTIPTITHAPSIGLALTVFKDPLIKFLNEPAV